LSELRIKFPRVLTLLFPHKCCKIRSSINVLLLGGGDKSSQQKDIQNARLCWGEYLVEELADCDEAVTFFQVVLEEYEKDHDNLAFLLDLESIIEAQGKKSKLAPQVYLMRGPVHHSLKQYDSAVEDYNTVLKLNPGDSMAHIYRTLAYYQNGDKDRALTYFHRA
jgi:tetratricopeptide (TPR) repeat protein